MFYELRQYRMRPGQCDKWVKCMEEEIIPFQVSKGMVIMGSFVGEEDDGLYVWIRRFDSEEERKRLYKEVYESDYWKNEIAPKVAGHARSRRHRGEAHRRHAKVGDSIAPAVAVLPTPPSWCRKHTGISRRLSIPPGGGGIRLLTSPVGLQPKRRIVAVVILGEFLRGMHDLGAQDLYLACTACTASRVGTMKARCCMPV